ncbi:MAG: Xaa-Pro peptidase family protein [Rhodomicrobium sp.]
MPNIANEPDNALQTPFEMNKLDALMDDAGIDILIVNSKHNIQYLLGHRSQFFQFMDAIGTSRYLPLFVYPKGLPDKAAYLGHRLESYQRQVRPFWAPTAFTDCGGTLDAMQKAIEHVQRTGVKAARFGIESAFLPADAANALKNAFPDSAINNALFVLERLRAIKRPEELEMLRHASDCDVESMKAVFASHGAGVTKRQLVEALRREQTNSGLVFDYCLITMGTSLNRAVTDQAWEPGDIVSLDSGANYEGYIGDVCRMGILGEPDSELEDLLSEIEAIQRAGMKPVKPGAKGKAIYEAAEPLVRNSKNHNNYEFVAHGMGLVSHEAPRMSTTGPIPYDDHDADLPLESGMVISIETTLLHPRRGFIKLEDTVAVTDSGYEIYGEGGRGWNRASTA